MALKGADISATYQDWVHVNKAGAGLADHAGAEAALYLDDGAGGVDQICGRTAVRHWLDPHPDAASFAETWEFSTTGDMTQGQLETAGWTFSNCSGLVSNGMLWLTATANARAKAYLTVSLSGDFDFTASSIFGQSYGQLYPGVTRGGGVGVGDPTVDVIHFSEIAHQDGNPVVIKRVNGDWDDHNGTETFTSCQGATPMVLRVSRVGGTVYVTGGTITSPMVEDDTSFRNAGWVPAATAVDATTFTRLALPMTYTASAIGDVVGFYFLRRFQ